MTRTLPTEESLGLSPTEDELNTSVTHDDDDVEINDEAPPVLSVAKPGDEKTPAKADDEPPVDSKQPEEPPKAEEPKLVDVRAVQEARAEARAAKQQAAIMEQRWNDFLAYQNAPKQAEPEKPAIPGPEDPMGRVNWTTEQLIALQEQQQRREIEQRQQTAQEQAFQQAFAQVDADFRAAAAADPTVTEAYSKLRESYGAELLAMGYTIPQAQQELARMERETVAHVAQTGVSVADYIKSRAKARGWSPAAPAPATPPKTDLAAVAAAQQRHQSLSDAPGGESIAPLDAKALARMTDKEFKAWMSKKGNEAKFDELMGR